MRGYISINIIVPIKQVPDIERVRFDTEKGRIDRSSAQAEINPFDLNALEAAVRIKEKTGGTVTAISMGPPQAEEALRDALARGADRAILLTDKRFAGADTLATSYTLAGAIKKIGGFDLIICGEKTIDGDTGQVGPEIAEHLNIPHIAYISKIDECSKEGLLITSEMGEYRNTVELNFPALITVTKDINWPRLPTLRDRLRAGKAKIERWGADELMSHVDVKKFGTSGSSTKVFRISFPSEESRRGEIFKGKPEESVRKLIERLIRKW